MIKQNRTLHKEMTREFLLKTIPEAEELQNDPGVDQNKLDQFLLQVWPALQAK